MDSTCPVAATPSPESSSAQALTEATGWVTTVFSQLAPQAPIKRLASAVVP